MELREMIEKLVRTFDKEANYWCNFIIEQSKNKDTAIYGAAVGRSTAYNEAVMMLNFALQNNVEKFEDFLSAYDEVKEKYGKPIDNSAQT